MKKLLSELFSLAVKKRNKNYNEGLKKIHKCVSPVISVGNLSVGGSGKTPFVQYLVQKLIDLGYYPGIVGRGYKRKSKGRIIISDGEKILTNAMKGGDEMLLLAESLKVPVIAHDMKFTGALELESLFNINCIILDDGFQHRKLYRDLDIVLIDKETLQNPFLIPKGRLREPLDSLGRADIICLMGDIDVDNYGISQFCDDKLVIRVQAKPGIPFLSHNDKKIYKTGLDMISVSGIAKPESFRLMLEALKFNVIKNIPFSDHHQYKKSDIIYMINACKDLNINNIATTEKDIVKLREFTDIFASNELNVIVFPITLTVVEGESELINLLKITLKKVKK